MTLEELLSTCAQLEPTVNVKVIVVSLLNRLANFTIENNEGTDNVSIVDVDGQKEKLNIFKMFFGQLKVLLEKQDEESVTSTADQLEMLVALLNLSLKYYPKVVTNVDEVLEFTATLLASKGKKWLVGSLYSLAFLCSSYSKWIQTAQKTIYSHLTNI
tara:strand:+ start:360 stop:833 length:474 start_codon:yes stop_codon:yes gene_type:complete